MSVKVTGVTHKQIEALVRYYPTASNGRQMMQLGVTTAKFWGGKRDVLIALDEALTTADPEAEKFIERVIEKVESA